MVPHHNFVVIPPMITKTGTGIELDVFYTMVKELTLTEIGLTFDYSLIIIPLTLQMCV